jgi:hypothetical protein
MVDGIKIMCGFSDTSNEKTVCTPDDSDLLSYTSDKHPELFDANFVRKKLHLSKEDYYPVGALAHYLIYESKNWGWLGKTEMECALTDGAYYQKFTNGIIYGPFRNTWTRGVGIAYVVSSGDWATESLNGLPPPIEKCDE